MADVHTGWQGKAQELVRILPGICDLEVKEQGVQTLQHDLLVLRALQDLRSIHIEAFGALGDAELCAVCGCTGLTRLSFHRVQTSSHIRPRPVVLCTPITSRLWACLKGVELAAQARGLTDKGLSHLNALERLQFLSLQGATCLTSSGFKELQIPRLQVHTLATWHGQP